MTTQCSQHIDDLANSTPVYALVGQEGSVSVAESVYAVVHAEVSFVFQIEKGLQVSSPHLARTARVLRPFYVKVGLDHGEFIATSDVSDVYESGEMEGLTVLNYLRSLVDELVWFQEHRGSLSETMLENFNRLQFYLVLV
jgi:hypothetical protein